MRIEAKLGLDAFKLDDRSHITINQEACRTRCELKPCLVVCPADLYSVSANGEMQVDYEGCLECGTCMVVCPEGALEWVYPRAGLGVHYRFG
jgi:ferredoxin like protein